MKTRIVRIGNSRGIRIPGPLLEQAGVRDEVEIGVRAGALIIRPAGEARAVRADASRAMARRGDDAPLDEARPSRPSGDEDEWPWCSDASPLIWRPSTGSAR